MLNVYRLEIERRYTRNDLDVIYDFLDLYNGQAGYCKIAEITNYNQLEEIVTLFVLERLTRRNGNIVALVVEDQSENVINILYEDNGKIKWSEDNASEFFKNALSDKPKGKLYKNADGYHFYSKNGITYEILEGTSIGCSEEKTSDIIFVFLADANYIVENNVVGWLFGASDFEEFSEIYEEQIAEIVEKYEMENF